MRIGYIGNFNPPHSTENEVRRALEHLGHDVVRFQENDEATWRSPALSPVCDVVLWTRTGWDWQLCCGWSHAEAMARQAAMLELCATRGIPTVGYHLDRWWGLDREPQILDEQFFRVGVLFTADGGHDDEWKAAGVNHRWLPPAVSEFECAPGRPRREFAAEVAFVGTWRSLYHAEWEHRPQLVEWLRRNYRGRVKFFPPRGSHAIRGELLRDLYASTLVNVGDSCLAGGITNYWSDRIPETLGRGGFLLHPAVEGLDEHFESGRHLVTWTAGDWDGLREVIDYYAAHHDERREIADEGRAHVLNEHTYTVRMRHVLEQIGVAA